MDRCERCNGLMVQDYAWDLLISQCCNLFICVNCGARVDEAILVNRSLPHKPKHPKRTGASHTYPTIR